MSNLVTLENKTEALIMHGDLSKLSAEERVQYVIAICKELGLNHLTRPFDYISFKGKLVLYAKKEATDQLRQIHGVSVTEIKKEIISGILTVTAYGETKSGKKDVATGALVVEGLKGEDLANAMMKAETKAKRRLTLSICGLGLLDESEINERDVTAELGPQDAQPSQFEDDERVKKIKELFAKFFALGVAPEEICYRYDISDSLDLSEAQIKELNSIGGQIKNKKAKKEDYFTPKLEEKF
jgi:hypothetical protein